MNDDMNEKTNGWENDPLNEWIFILTPHTEKHHGHAPPQLRPQTIKHRQINKQTSEQKQHRRLGTHKHYGKSVSMLAARGD